MEGVMTLIDPEDIPNIVELRIGGYSWLEIAQKYDCSVQTVQQRLRQAGHNTRAIGIPAELPITSVTVMQADLKMTPRPHAIICDNARHIVVMPVAAYLELMQRAGGPDDE
jgi:hypothetical protein